jgi:GT2 family glycosyltransferase
VVIDNASTDGTADALARDFPDVRLIRLAQNLGTSARNLGAEAASAPLLFMLDDDSFPLPGALEAAAAALQDPTLGVAAGMVELADGQWEEGGSAHVHIGCAAAMRRSEYLRLGGYDGAYETYVEEYDLAFRFLAEGQAVRYSYDWAARHEPHARASYDYMIEKLTANNIYLAWKFFPDDEAEAFCRWIVRRYRLVAQDKNATAGYERALAAVEERRALGLRDRRMLPDRALDFALPSRLARRLIAEAGLPRRPLAFLRAGKEINDLVLAARAGGFDAAAIYDDGPLKGEPDIEGAPVRPLGEATRFRGTLLIGGLSPGFIANTRRQAQRARLDRLRLLPGAFQP